MHATISANDFNIPHYSLSHTLVCMTLYRMSGRGATYSVGETSWLSGMNGTNTRGAVFTIGCGKDVLVVRWKTSILEVEPSCGREDNDQDVSVSLPKDLSTDALKNLS